MTRLCLALLMAVLAVVSIRAEDHPGWDRGELLARAAELLQQPEIETADVEQFPERMFLLDPGEEKSCFVAPGERVEAFTAGDFSSVLLIGDGERVHTVWFYFPVLNISDPQPVWAFYAGFFDYLLPGWAGGNDWAEVSLGKAWGASAKAYQDPMISFEEMIARETVAGVALSTWGVPPDIVTYRVTARAGCEKISDYLLAKPRQAERDPATRDMTRETAGLQLYYSQKQPVDMSAMPVFLGQVSAFRPRTAIEPEIRLGTPGPLSGEAIELSAWLDAQVQTPQFPDFAAVAEDGWGYESNFMFAVGDPLIALGPEHTLVVTRAIGSVQRKAPDTYDVVWSDLSGLLFGTEMVPAVDDRTDAPPYQMVNAGQLVYASEASAVPVDIGATPVHLGGLRQYYGATSIELPPPYSGVVEGLSLTIADGSGATAVLDLGAWAASQVGEPFSPGRVHPVSQPVIAFTLSGRAHLLAVNMAAYDAPEGTPSQLTGIFGELFAAP